MKRLQPFTLPAFFQSRLMLTIAIAALIFMIWHFSANSKTTRSASSILSVTVQTIESSPLNSSLELFGKVIALEQVPVYADMMQGRITKVLVDEGDHVKAGQQLAVVDTSLAKVQRVQSLAGKQRAIVGFSEAEAALENAKKQLEQARAEKARGEKVAEDGLISKETLEQRVLAEQAAESKVNTARNQLRIALSDLLAANAQVDEADLKIKQAELIAPATGRIIQKNAVVGQLLSQSSQPQFLLARGDTLEVDTQTTPEEAASLKNGMPVVIKVAGMPGTYRGTIRKKSVMIHDENQMVHIKVAFSKAPELMPGQSASVSVKLPHRDGIRLPDSAITAEGNQYFVYTVEQQHAKRIAVSIGQRVDGQVEIIHGVTPGMRIIDKFAGFVRDGEPVNVIQAAH